MKQTVQLRTIDAGERHLLFTRNNVGCHIGQTCLNKLLFPHPLKRQFGITFAQYSWSFSLPWIKRIQRNRLLRNLLALAWVNLIKEGAKKVISLWR